MTKVLILNLPSPPKKDIMRDYAGGYGTSHEVKRKSYGHSFDVVFPVFLPYLASDILRENYQLRVLDAQVEKLNQEDILKRVEKENPDFLVSCLSLPSLYGDIFLLNKIKETFPEIFLVGIGTVCNSLPEEILMKSKINAIIRGEYPFYGSTLKNLISAILSNASLKKVKGISYLEKNKVKNNPPPSLKEESLDNLNLNVYKLFPIKKYKLYFNDLWGKNWNYFPVLTSKGCPFPCIYCPYPFGFGRKIQHKSIKKLINELEYLNKNFNIQAFLFRDQIFTFNKERAKEITKSILERNLEIKWLFETRIDKISKNLLQRMRESGCNRIHYGVETGDENLLREIGKPGIIKKQIKQVISDTKEQEILTMAHVILGLPGENKKTLINTYKFISELNPDQVSWNVITPYPGTSLFNLAQEKKLILTDDWSRYTSGNAVMRTENLSGDELLQTGRKFTLKFELRKFFEVLGKSFHQRREAEFLVRRSFYHLPLLFKKLFY